MAMKFVKNIIIVVVLMIPFVFLLWYFYSLTLDKPEWLFSKVANVYFTKSEITVGQYRLCTSDGVCSSAEAGSDKCNNYHNDRDDHPVNCVNWVQAERYCKWAGGRLPTEEEWYMEASNMGKRRFPWGDEPLSCDLAAVGNTEDASGCDMSSTLPVCSKPDGNSISGLCDMTGNVWEWTSSGDGKKRVIRGGSIFDTDASHYEIAFKYYSSPSAGYRNLGFRCVK